MKISVLITAYKEPKQVKRAIDYLLKDKEGIFEILISAPDRHTIKVIKNISKVETKVKLIEEKERLGKPNAVNNLIKQAKGDILILTDGDCYIKKGSVKAITESFKKSKNIGIITGKVLTVNSKSNLLGFWSHFLVNCANKIRQEKTLNNQFFFASGYLLAVKRELVDFKIPNNCLVDDAFISKKVYKNN